MARSPHWPRTSTRRARVLAVAVAIAALFALPQSALADQAGPPSGEQDVQPVLVPGNPKCNDYGLDGGEDAPVLDGYAGSGAPNGNYPIGAEAGLSGTVTISNSNGLVFDWDSTIGITRVIVKAGEVGADSYLYNLPGPATSDTLLHAPLKDDGTYRTISHASFCYDDSATVIVEKQNVGGPASDAFGFNPSADLDSGPDFTLTDDQTKTYTGLDPNNSTTDVYQVVEKSGIGEPQGYTLTDITCRRGTAANDPVDSDSTTDVFNRTATIKVSAGEVVKCVFTNTKQPEIKVVKELEPPGDAGRFDLKIDSTTFDNGGAGYGDGGTTGFQPTTIGQHTVSEVAHSGTNLADYNSKVECDSSKGSTNPGTSHTFSVVAGDKVTCTITNTRKTRLTVIKHVINDNGGTAQAGQFGIAVDDPGDNHPPFAGQEAPGTTIEVDPGAYTVTEFGGASGYTGSYSADCSGQIAVGEHKTCTITNDDDPPTPQTQPPPEEIEVLGVQKKKKDTRRPNLVVGGLQDGCRTRDFAATVRVSDASRIRRVTVKLDGRVIKRAKSKRFSARVPANRLGQGRHRLTFTAVDATGNRRTVSRSFTRCAPPVVPNFTG